jgi:translation initiation factor 3 subunit A
LPLARGRSGRSENERDGSPAPAPSASTETLKPSGAPGKWIPRHLRDKV